MTPHSPTLLSYLHHLAAPAAPDAVLLTRWIDQRDESAFSVLMARHGPMVLGVCRRVLGDVQDAEDAFQATFLVLARQAAKLRSPEALASFLYGIALRLARKARAAAKRRPKAETTVAIPEPADPQPHVLDVLSGRELIALVDAEIARLPEVYRLPLLLCLLQGRTIEEAARQLDWTIGSLRGRLERGREQLRQRLTRRGIGLSVGALALLTPAVVPEKLLAESVRHLSGTVPATISVLAAGSASAIKKVACVLLMLVAATGVSLVAVATPRPSPPATPTTPPPQAKDEPRRDRYGDPLPEGAVARLGTLRFRIDDELVRGLTFAPDGKTLAVVSSSGLWLLDAATGKRMKSFRPPIRSSFFRITFSPDSKRLLAAYQMQIPGGAKIAVQIWDVAGERKTDEVEMKWLNCLGWTAEGQPLAVYQGKSEINLYEIATGRKRRFSAKDLSDALPQYYSPCAVAKDVLVAGDEKGVIHVWKTSSGKERWTLKTGGEFPFPDSLVLSLDGHWLTSLSQDAAEKITVKLWDLTTGKAMHTIAADQQFPQSAVFASDGKTLATISELEVRFWDTASGRERGRLKGEGRSFNVSTVSFAPDGNSLATMESICGAIHLWDVATGECKPEPEGHSTNWVQTASFSPDGKRVASSGGLDGTIRVWDAATGRQLVRIRRPSPNYAGGCDFSADGRTLFSCWNDKLLLSDAATGSELHTLACANLNMYLSSDHRKAIALRVASEEGSGGGVMSDWLMTGWDMATRKQLFRRRLAYQDSHRMLAFSADANFLAVPDTKHETMHLEDVESGVHLLTFPTLKGHTNPLAFSTDGRLLLSETSTPAPAAPGGFDRTLRLWEVATASELLALPVSVYLSAKAAFSPNGSLLATIAPQGDILLWDLIRGKELYRFKGFDSPVTSLAFSPDSRRLVSGLYNSTLLIWDVSAPAPPGRLSAEAAAKAWTDLADKDAPRAFRARGALASTPEEAMPLLTKHLHAATSSDPQRLNRLLSDLDSEQFAVREKAQEELETLGDLAEPSLRKTLENKPTLEVRKRVQAILEHLHGPVTQPEMLRSLRAVAVLEDIGTPPARRLLAELAKGAPEARLTREAKASLRRLDIRRLNIIER